MGARERIGKRRRRTGARESAQQPWHGAGSARSFRGTLTRGRQARLRFPSAPLRIARRTFSDRCPVSTDARKSAVERLLASAAALLYAPSRERNCCSVTGTAQVETTVEGTLDHVLYVNEENGYSVAVVRTYAGRGDSRTVTIVGSLAGLEIGSAIRAHGRFEKHPRFGEQFKVEDYETLRPAGAFALERYLAAEIHGVGPSLARRIAEYFGDDLREVLDRAPERVREVSGVGPVVASRIAAAWKDSSGLRELVVFLRGHGIGAAHARRIHKRYGSASLEVVRRDPYVLARTIHGIGFRTADMVAAKLGIPKNSIERARAAILFLLERMADEGHVYAPREYLEWQFQSGLEIGADWVPRALEELVAGGALVVEKTDEHVAVYLAELHAAELNVGRRVRAL